MDATSASQSNAVDYLIVGLLTCARKGDMNSWTVSNLKAIDQRKVLRYIPNKTKGSSAVTVELAPLPKAVENIFARNQSACGKLMPHISGGVGRSLRTILKRYPIFERNITVRSPKGVFTTKKTYEAIKIHSLRSSGITYLLSRGIPELIVKRISGHTANSESFGLYTKVFKHTNEDALKVVFSKF